MLYKLPIPHRARHVLVVLLALLTAALSAVVFYITAPRASRPRPVPTTRTTAPPVPLIASRPVRAGRPARPAVKAPKRQVPVRKPGLLVSRHGRARLQNPLLRIGLLRWFEGTSRVMAPVVRGARLTDDDGVTYWDGAAEWRFTAQGDRVTVSDDTDFLLGTATRFCLEPSGRGDPLALARTGTTDMHRYRGALEITARGGALRLVNVVRMETYLRGVVPHEMPSTAPADALRAQTIAARTYAMANRDRYGGQGFDLTDTQASQVYGGVDAERVTTDAAVWDTAGLVLKRRDRLMVAMYAADCGGVSAPDRAGRVIVDAPPGGAPSYCAVDDNHAWTLVVTPEEVLQRMGGGWSSRLGTPLQIAVTARDASGRAARVVVTGETGERSMSGEQFRALFTYRRMRSTLFQVETLMDGTFVFTGTGYGHGQGMCQWGAIGMASAPYKRSFDAILAHYYPGAKIVPLTVTRLARRN